MSNFTVTRMLLGEAVGISREFGKFLSKGQPLVLDAQLLPYPKSKIEQALLIYEEHLCEQANKCVASGRRQELKEIDSILGPLRSCRGLLGAYSDIEPQKDVK